jgi:hypothetical protein
MEGMACSGAPRTLDIEGCAGVVVFEEREEDLLGVITETAIAHVGDDADDGAIGLDVRATTAPGDADAEGITAGQIALDEGLVHDGATGTDLAGGTGVALVEIAAGEDANAEGGEETAGGTRQRHPFRDRLEPALFGFTCLRVAEPRNSAALTAGFLPAFADKIRLPEKRLMIGRMIAPSAPMMLPCSRG